MRKSRLLFIGLSLVFIVGGLSRISFDIDIFKLLPAHLPQVKGLSLFLKNFSLPSELIITIESADSEKAEAAAKSLAEHLKAQPGLVKRVVWRPPWEDGGGALSEFYAWMLLNQRPEAFQALCTRMSEANAGTTLQNTLERLGSSLAGEELARLSFDPYDMGRELSLGSLMGNGNQSEFASADGTFRAIYVEAMPRMGNYKDSLAWMKEIRAAVAAWNKEGLKIGFTGEPAFVADISGSMEFDMMSSGFVTLFIIGLIFWFCYRRAAPLFALQAMLLIIFFYSLACAGYVLDHLTVVGVGFAAIMIGLSVDYGYLAYQKSLRHHGSLAELKQDCFQNIIWTAGTTVVAFFALNLSSLPGLAQLGNLVGIGVLVGGFVMLQFFVPLTPRWKRETEVVTGPEKLLRSPAVIRVGTWLALLVTVGLLGVLVVRGLPGSDFSSHPLRPRKSEAYETLDRLSKKLVNQPDLVSLVVTGANEEEVRARLELTGPKLKKAKEEKLLVSYRSPLPLWPSPQYQSANLVSARPLVSDLERLRKTALENEFTEDSLHLTEAVLQHWSRWMEEKPPIWPKNETSTWILRRVARHADGKYAALGIVEPARGADEKALTAELESEGVHISSWTLLGNELKRIVPGEFIRVMIGLVIIVGIMLFCAFRNLRDVLLLYANMALVFLTLAGAMSVLGMTWNFFNISAILLLLGTGIDYSILLLLALRRNGGNISEAQASIGVVVSLCAASACAGFGSISWANHVGLATLGQTCALGLALDAMITIFLLPVAWKLLRR